MGEIIAFPLSGHALPPDTCVPEASNDTEWRVCPWSDSVTGYDRQHIDLFYRLMHDAYEGATEIDIARNVFEINFWFQSQRARLVVRSHMRRAHWLAANVFPLLGW